MKGSSWITQVGPKSKESQCKRQTPGLWQIEEEAGDDTGGKNRSDASTSQGIPECTKSWGRQETKSPLAPQDKALSFCSFNLDFYPLGCEQINSCCFKPPSWKTNTDFHFNPEMLVFVIYHGEQKGKVSYLKHLSLSNVWKLLGGKRGMIIIFFPLLSKMNITDDKQPNVY